MSAEHTVEFTDSSFEQDVLQAKVPTLVDFWAEWCMPCKMVAPTIHELAEEYADRLKVGQMDCDKNRQVPIKFGISAIPTLLIFKDGQVVKKFVGVQQKADLKAAIDEVLA